MFLASIAVKKNIVSAVIVHNGTKVSGATYSTSIEDGVTNYVNWLDAFKTVLSHLKSCVDAVVATEDIIEVVFECRNEIMVQWCRQGFSRPEYMKQFSECMNLLHEIPVRYSFVVNKKPTADIYCKEKYIKKQKLESLSTMFDFGGEEEC